MSMIRCTFRPQAWVNNYAIGVDPEGPTTWDMDVQTLPKPNSYESDQLRSDSSAPAWVRDWHGPFEVDYERISFSDGDPGQDTYCDGLAADDDIDVGFCYRCGTPSQETDASGHYVCPPHGDGYARRPLVRLSDGKGY